MTKTKEFKFRLTEKEYEEMRELSEQEGRTMSNLLRYLVAKERKEREEVERKIERIRNMPKRATISQNEMEKYRTPQNDEVRE